MNTDPTVPTETLPPRYALKLLSAGTDRLRLLSEIRATRPDLSPTAAKALRDGAPSVIKNELLRSDVERLKWRFEDFAKVEIVQSDGSPIPQRLYKTIPDRSSSGLIDG